MDTERRKLPLFFIIVTIASAFLMVRTITVLFNTEKIDIPFSSNQNVFLEEDTNFYLMYDEHRESNRYSAHSDGGVYNLQVDGGWVDYTGLYKVLVQNTDTGTYYEVEPMPTNTSVTVNDSYAVGKVDLPSGNYLIISDVVSGAENGSFHFSQRGLILQIFIIIFSVFGIIGGFVFSVLRYFHVNKRLPVNSFTTNSTNIYETTSKENQDLFDDDDPFSKYD